MLKDENKEVLRKAFGASSRFFVFEDDVNLNEIVEGVPAFKNQKIISYAGEGGFGITFFLQNDHVIKLYIGSVGHKIPDDITHDKNKELAFTSMGSIYTPMIYDRGSVPLTITKKNQTTLGYMGNKGSMSYVEMNRVFPFDKWLKRTRKATPEQVLNAMTTFKQMANDMKSILRDVPSVKKLSDIKRIAKGQFFGKPKDPAEANAQRYATQNAQMFQMYFQQKFQDRQDPLSRLLTEKEIVGILKMLFQFAKHGNSVKDFHAGNIGILPQSDPSDPVFVFFDN